MRAKVQDMTAGSPAKLLVRFAVPLVIGSLFQQLYIMVDTMVVGQGVSVEALASVGAADWLYWLFLGMMTGLTQGFSILFAQYYGAKDEKQMRRSVGNALVLTVYFLVFLELFGQLGVTAALKLLHTPSDIIEGSILYLRILMAGAPVVLGYNLLAALLRSLGDSQNPLYSMLAASVINVVLDLLFVMGFHWGIAGAAAATVIAQGFSFLWCIVVVLKIDFIKPERADFRLEGKTVYQLFRLAVPIIFQNSVIAVGGMAVQYVINGFGLIFVAGFTATNKLYGLLETAAISFGFAMMTYAGQNVGAGDYPRIRRGMQSGTRMAVLTSVVISAVMLLAGREILGLFIPSDAADRQAVLGVAYKYLSVMSFTLALLYMLHLYRSALQGLGNAVIPMWSGILEFFMRVSAALVLPKIIGNNGIFYAESLAWLGAVLLLIPSYFISIRKLERGSLKGEKI